MSKHHIKIDCISDLHGFFPELEGGDLLIVAGDLTARDTPEEYDNFCNWCQHLNYNKIIVIGGNHDNLLQFPDETGYTYWQPWSSYLCDSGTEFEGLKIWGTPWTKTFKGMNPKCKAFTLETEEELDEKWQLIPFDIDILITHEPPHGILEQVRYYGSNIHVGSKTLRNNVIKRIKPKLHVFGHIHEFGGRMVDLTVTKFVNASIMNEVYDPVHKPVRVII